MPPAKRSSSSRSSSSSSSGSGGSGRSGSRKPATSRSPAARSPTSRSEKRGARSTPSGSAPSGATPASGAGRVPAQEITSIAEQLVRGALNPRDLVLLTRDRIQDTLDDAASRGRVTRKDANDLVSELVRRGRSQSDDLLGEIEAMLDRGRDGLESATRRARGSDSVDRIVRGADRARRTVGVGPSFPILGYDELTAAQVRTRIKQLSKPELRKTLNYERRHSNRKTVVAALERSLR
jgi:polyhydroxyalkanoate synthesis regulator phasin